MKIALIQEGKIPPDARVPLAPAEAVEINRHPDFSVVLQPTNDRCYLDAEYQEAGIQIQQDLSDCDILLGVKEVPIDQLVPNKTYFFFSHTIKKQSYNRKLLRAVLKNNIRLIDYEVLTDEKGRRLIAFGIFAGMVGAHNGLLTYGRRTDAFKLPRMYSFHDYAEAKEFYKTLQLPAVRIVLTGTGRVGQGAAMVLKDMGIRQVEPQEFLTQSFDEAVFCQLKCKDYVATKNGDPFDKNHYYEHPEAFRSIFSPYFESSDIMINGIYWDNQAPAFFTREQMAEHSFRLKVIADVTCDIAPVSSIPSTLRASTIADPIFGYDPQTGLEADAHHAGVVDMMTVDNLPNELPRDASSAFGKQFVKHIFPELQKEESPMLLRATIAQNGQLGPHFQYLKDYVDGVE